MTERSVAAIYDRMRDAENAIHFLEQSGYPVNQISFVSRDLESEKQVHGFITTGMCCWKHDRSAQNANVVAARVVQSWPYVVGRGSLKWR